MQPVRAVAQNQPVAVVGEPIALAGNPQYPASLQAFAVVDQHRTVVPGELVNEIPHHGQALAEHRGGEAPAVLQPAAGEVVAQQAGLAVDAGADVEVATGDLQALHVVGGILGFLVQHPVAELLHCPDGRRQGKRDEQQAAQQVDHSLLRPRSRMMKRAGDSDLASSRSSGGGSRQTALASHSAASGVELSPREPWAVVRNRPGMKGPLVGRCWRAFLRSGAKVRKKAWKSATGPTRGR